MKNITFVLWCFLSPITFGGLFFLIPLFYGVTTETSLVINLIYSILWFIIHEKYMKYKLKNNIIGDEFEKFVTRNRD